jgi:high-affinity iron transporter
LLKGTVNFTPNTTWLQAIAWVLYLVPTMTVFLLRTRAPRPTAPVAPAPSPVRTH